MKQSIKRLVLSGLMYISVAFMFAQDTPKINVVFTSGKSEVYKISDAPVITYSDDDVSISSSLGTVRYMMKDIAHITFITTISAIALSETEVEIEIGQTRQLEINIQPEDAENTNLTWSSSDDNVAMVSSSGTIIALSEGVTTIKVQTQDGSETYATCTVKVVPVKVKKIELNYSSYSLKKGESVVLEATVWPQNAANKSIVWTTSDDNVLMVNSQGVVYCLASGRAVITATTTDGSNISATCVFNDPTAISSPSASDDGEENVYRIDGKQVLKKSKGINIISNQNGTYRKVIVR